MLKHNIAAVLAVLALPAPSVASGATRTVEIVRMGSSAAPEVQEQDNNSPKATVAGAFHVLDLTRARISDTMLRSFSTPATDGEDVIRRDALAPYSDISAPAWMRAPLRSMWPTDERYIPSDCITVPYRPVGFLKPEVEGRRRAAYTAMSAAACDAGIPVGLFDALILTESGYNARAVSPKQAYGFTQLMPGTAADLGVDRYDPVQNLHGGARYLRTQLDRFGMIHLALAAYNAGPGRVKGGQIPLITETQNYVRNVLDKWILLAGNNQVLPVGDFDGPPAIPTIAARPGRAASVQIF